MRILRIPIERINPAPYNPRKDLAPGDPEYERLRRSVERWDLVEPLVWNERSGNLVGGHQRLKILIARGDTEVEVSVVDLDAHDEAALNVALNKIGGEWDLPKLADLLSTLDAEGFDATLTGFDTGELEKLLTWAAPNGNDPDAVPELPVDPVSKRGDIWVLGRHRVMCGDATSAEDVAALMDGIEPAAILTDPPYGIDVVKVSGDNRTGTVRSGKPYPVGGVKGIVGGAIGGRGRVHGPAKRALIAPREYAPVIGDDSTETARQAFALTRSLGARAEFWWGGNYYADALPPSRCWIVWDKENTGSFADAELAWTNLDKPVRIFRHMWNGLMKASERGAARVHPTQKPAALAEWCLREHAPDCESILDLFGGSGWTLIGCEKLNRTAYLMELSEAYIDVIVNRWEQYTGKKAELLTPAGAP